MLILLMNNTLNHEKNYITPKTVFGACQLAHVVKAPPANAGDVRGVGSIPGLGRSSEGEHGNSLQYSCLENLMGRRI